MQTQYPWSNIEGLESEENADRLKLVWPVRRNWPLFILFSFSLLVWVVLLIGMIIAIFRGHYGGLLTTMLVIWWLAWAWFGRVLWARWEFYAATREILYLDESRLIIRRPVSILGITDAYDMAHVSSFYINDKLHCPGFDYGFQRIFFGQSLSDEAARKLVSALNGRFFPDELDED